MHAINRKPKGLERITLSEFFRHTTVGTIIRLCVALVALLGTMFWSGYKLGSAKLTATPLEPIVKGHQLQQHIDSSVNSNNYGAISDSGDVNITVK